MQLRSCEFKELVAGESNGSAYEQTGCSKKDLPIGGSGRSGSDCKQKPLSVASLSRLSDTFSCSRKRAWSICNSGFAQGRYPTAQMAVVYVNKLGCIPRFFIAPKRAKTLPGQGQCRQALIAALIPRFITLPSQGLASVPARQPAPEVARPSWSRSRQST